MFSLQRQVRVGRFGVQKALVFLCRHSIGGSRDRIRAVPEPGVWEAWLASKNLGEFWRNYNCLGCAASYAVQRSRLSFVENGGGYCIRVLRFRVKSYCDAVCRRLSLRQLNPLANLP
jgi:hypothetical protein